MCDLRHHQLLHRESRSCLGFRHPWTGGKGIGAYHGSDAAELGPWEITTLCCSPQMPWEFGVPAFLVVSRPSSDSGSRRGPDCSSSTESELCRYRSIYAVPWSWPSSSSTEGLPAPSSQMPSALEQLNVLFLNNEINNNDNMKYPHAYVFQYESQYDNFLSSLEACNHE